MYRAAARRVCRCHGRDRDEAQQPPPTCWLPHLATATGVGWLRFFWFSTAPARAPGVRRCAQVFGDEDPGVQDRLPQKGARRASICSPMSGDIGVDAGDPAQHGREQELVMVGEMPVERSAQPILPVLYLDRRRLNVRIHGRPRSDRKRRFLLSAVAPGASTRHPREARPINWAQRGGPASGEKYSSRRRGHISPHHHARLVIRWLCFGRPSFSSGEPSDSCMRTPGAGQRPAARRSEHTASWVIVSLGGARIVEHRRVQRARPRHHRRPRRPGRLESPERSPT